MVATINSLVGGIGLASMVVVASLAHAQETLDRVREAGEVRCGVNDALPGFGERDRDGSWHGLDVDYCRAIAAAAVGDPAKVRFVPLSTQRRFKALEEGDVDVLARNTTWTMERDTALGLDFAGVNYFDGQGFMVRDESDIRSVFQLAGSPICVKSGTTTALNLKDYFQSHDMAYTPVVLDDQEAVNAAYEGRECDALTMDASGLAAARLEMSDPEAHVILPETISKEPLGPVVREGDDQWFDLVRWVHFALLDAEELGVTRQNVDAMKNSQDPRVQRLVGSQGDFGEGLGLDAEWAARAIAAVGNYGEIFERNLGMDSPLKLERGPNALWVNGGLMYGIPIR